MTITKPIDLIIANAFHGALGAVREFEMIKSLISKVGKMDEASVPKIHDAIARKLLCEISHEAHISKVFEALKAVGAPSSTEDIAEGLRAVKERQT